MKEYKVLGDREVLGHQPGDQFSANIPTKQEARLVGRGQLEVVSGQSAPAPPEEAPPQGGGLFGGPAKGPQRDKGVSNG